MSTALNGIAIVGGGTMGTALARLTGIRALVIEPDSARRTACENALAPINEESVHDALTIAAKWPSKPTVAAVVECVTESMVVKQSVIIEAERHVAADALILTNTSSLSIDDIGSNLEHPERFLGAHFFNPPDIVPAVEVVPGSNTSEIMLKATIELLRSMGKRPAVVRKAIPGFVVNRIQHAMLRECLSLIENDVIDPAALDDLVRNSIGIRMAINGPLYQRDLNGLDTHLRIARYLYPDLESRQTPAPLLAEYVRQGRLGAKSGHGFYDWHDVDQTEIGQRERHLLTRIIDWVNDPNDGAAKE